MALQPSPTVGRVSHDAQVNVDRLSKEIIKRGKREIVERRETESRVERLAKRHGTDDPGSPQEVRDRAQRRRLRAHRTVMGTTEPVPGSPRSGSA